jgi:hypothetical protein
MTQEWQDPWQDPADGRERRGFRVYSPMTLVFVLYTYGNRPVSLEVWAGHFGAHWDEWGGWHFTRTGVIDFPEKVSV